MKAAASAMDSADLRAWLGKSRARDEARAPVVGVRVAVGTGAGLGFVTVASANAAAQDLPDAALEPAYLRIERPFVETPDEALVDLGLLMAAIGVEQVRQAVVLAAADIQATGSFEAFRDAYESVAEMARRASESELGELQVPLQALMANPQVTAELSRAGFDGAIFGAAGAQHWVVFSERQVRPAISAGWPHRPTWATPDAPAPATGAEAYEQERLTAVRAAVRSLTGLTPKDEALGRMVVGTSSTIQARLRGLSTGRSAAVLANAAGVSPMLKELMRLRVQAHHQAMAEIGDHERGVVLRRPNASRWVLVLPDASKPGNWRVQHFNLDGLDSHVSVASREQAYQTALHAGFTLRDDGALDRIQDTTRFQRGLLQADLQGQRNRGEISLLEFRQQLADFDRLEVALASIGSRLEQAACDLRTGSVFLLADRIAAGHEHAVILHELTHKHGRNVLGVAGWKRLVGGLRAWKDAPRASSEHLVFLAADARARAATGADQALYEEELFAYGVEEAILRGFRPKAMAQEGSVEQWLSDVESTMRGVLMQLTRAPQEPLQPQQLVDLAYAMAQLENPERADLITQRMGEGFSRLVKEAEMAAAQVGAASRPRTAPKPVRMSNKAVGEAFRCLVNELKDDLQGVLMNWQDAELSESEEDIVVYPGRDREFSRGGVGGRHKVGKREFLEWLQSDGPFDTERFGKEILTDREWRGQIHRLRRSAFSGSVRNALVPLKELAKLTDEEFRARYVVHFDLGPDPEGRVASMMAGPVHGEAEPDTDRRSPEGSRARGWATLYGYDRAGARAYIFPAEDRDPQGWIDDAVPVATVVLSRDGQTVLEALQDQAAREANASESPPARPPAPDRRSSLAPVSAATHRRLAQFGEPVAHLLDAQRRLGDGERLFVFHEQDEEPFEVRDVQDLRVYTPDQMLALPPAPGDRQTESAAFKAWFGDWQDRYAHSSRYPAEKTPVSQAVDGNGSPRPMYHATNGDFGVFETARATVNSTTFGPVETERHAIFVAPDVGFAEEHLRGVDGANVMPVYLDVKAPADLRDGVPGEVISEIVARTSLRHSDFWHLRPTDTWQLFDGDFGRQVVSALKDAGYDGAILTEVNKAGTAEFEVWAAFEPQQVKSAIGNDGEFSASRDITHSLARQVTESPAFRGWFGDSVATEDGKPGSKPLVAFHGTTADFQAFRPHERRGEQLGFGVHFTSDPAFASRYAGDAKIARRGSSPQVLPVYLAISKPLVADAVVEEGTPEFALAEKLAGSKLITVVDDRGRRTAYLQNAIDATSGARAARLIQEAGYDGVRYQSRILEPGAHGSRSVADAQSWVVFRPEQIKSAIGNSGAFDALRSEILSSVPRQDGIVLHLARDADGEGYYLQARDTAATNALGAPLAIAHLHVPDEAVSGRGWAIGDIYVQKDYQRQGIATRMVEEMCQHLGSQPTGAASVFTEAGAAFFASLSGGRQAAQHGRALEETGFWGRAGAGSIVMARESGRILLALRSEQVLEPGTWGTWGGAIDETEHPAAAALRELREEAGVDQEAVLLPLLVFQHGEFRYHNHLALVDREFEPVLNEETADFRWTRPDEIPLPMHPGLQALLADLASSETIRRLSEQFGTSAAAAPQVRAPDRWLDLDAAAAEGTRWDAVRAELQRKHDVTLDIRFMHTLGVLHCEWIQARNPGRGSGTDAMRELVARADEAGMPMTLRVSAGNTEQMLESLYAEFGFVPQGDLRMRREPGAPVRRPLWKGAAFKQWFGRSVILRKGTMEPMVAHHGTRSDFAVSRPSVTGAEGPGIYMSDGASEYGAKSMRLFVRMENPFWFYPSDESIDAEINGELIEQVLGADEAARIIQRMAVQGRQAYGTEVRDALRARGHDGIVMVYPFGEPALEGASGAAVLIAFDPEQVKSADANDGRFSRETADIRFSIPAAKLPVVYHGTSERFDQFASSDRGIWFAENPREARDYAQWHHDEAKAGPPRVIAAQLTISNPYEPTEAEVHEWRAATEADIGFEQLERELVARATALGHDSIRMPHGYWVAFEPSQVLVQPSPEGRYRAPRTQTPPARLAPAVQAASDNPAFRDWFEDSVVVDAQGWPLPVFHGTTRSFARFSTAKLGEKTGALDAKTGFFFAENPDAASQFTWEAGEPYGGNLMPVFLRLRNPYVIRDVVLDGSVGTKVGMLMRRAQALGHDGVVFERSDMLGHQGRCFAVFEPGQIKSVTANRGRWSLRNSDIRLSMPAAAVASAPARAPGVFSRSLTDLIQANGPHRATPAHWSGFIRGLQGVGRPEVEWSGVLAWLEGQGGMLSRSEVADYLRTHGVNVTEVHKGGQHARDALDSLVVRAHALGFRFDRERFLEGGEIQGREIGFRRADPSDGDDLYYEWDGRELVATTADAEPQIFRAGEIVRIAESIGQLARDEANRADEMGTQYSEWTLPGGQGYREVLLTLRKQPRKTHRVFATGGPVEDLPDVADFDTHEEADAELTRRRAAQPRLHHVKMEFEKLASEGGPYRSPHWDESNVLAHVRLTDRLDPEGRRVLFVEELQSDWAEDGRRKGFLLSGAQRAQLRPGSPEAIAALATGAAGDMRVQVDDGFGRPLTMTLTPAAREAKALVPPGPYVHSTEAWLALALKRVFTMAASEGYDAVAFVTGQQSVDRYGLGEQHGLREFYDTVVPRAVNRLLARLCTDRIAQVAVNVGGDEGTLALQPGFLVTPEMREQLAPRVEPTPIERWIAGTRVAAADGRPERVYRGEHGATRDGQLQTLLGTFTFSSAQVASTYAMQPNDAGGRAEAPRVVPAYLAIRNPVFENRDDPFVEMAEIERKFGTEFTRDLVVRAGLRGVTNTGNWEENFAPKYAHDIARFLREEPQALSKVYMDAYVLLDDPEFIDAAREAGYDGAIHLGNGESALELEYRVFDREQVRYALAEGVLHSVPAAPGAPRPGWWRAPRDDSFRDWFAGSRVRSPVFHATSADFNTFDTTRGDLGTHFGTLQQALRVVERGERDGRAGRRIIPAWLKLANPLRLVDEGSFHADGIAEQLERKGLLAVGEGTRIRRECDADWRARKIYDPQLRQVIQDAGFDGVVYANRHEGAGDSYIAFEPQQIRTALDAHGQASQSLRHSMPTRSAPRRAVRPPEVLAANEYPASGREHRVRDVAQGLRAGEAAAIEQAAQEMAAIVPPGVTLIPVPGSTGDTHRTAALALRISELCGAAFSDILIGVPRPSQYACKKAGVPLSAEQMPMRLRDGQTVPTGAVLVDSVAGTGETLRAARLALRFNAPALVYAAVPTLQGACRVHYGPLPARRPAPASTGGPTDPYDFAADPAFHHLFFGTPSAQDIAEFARWLRERPDCFVRLYHGTAAKHPVQEQGLLPTSMRRRNSYQSANGYVCASVYPSHAHQFGVMSALNSGGDVSGYRVAVYPVTVTLRRLCADLDQLRNRRMGGVDCGNSLAESLIFGHGARMRGRVEPYALGAPRLYRTCSHNEEGDAASLNARPRERLAA
ncbi:GNAT family N-acetyltransferase [Ramlibacter sp. AN1133]|uniref:GNAT family N-acetyltransferase n=1 Tax=Ramlibacter sp. AN1133 TaxID=3133429 RepID=UPI0030C051DC